MSLDVAISYLLNSPGGHSPFDRSAISILARQSQEAAWTPATRGSTLPRYSDLVDLCIQVEGDPYEIARVMVASVAFNPERASGCLTAFVYPFVLEPDAVRRWQYQYGVALGLFQAALWLDEQCLNRQADLDGAFRAMLRTLMTSRELSISEPIMEWPHVADKTEYEERLGRAIKDFVRCSKVHSGIGATGSRTWCVHSCIEFLSAHLVGRELSWLAQLIAGQILYAEFGRLPLHSRARALFLFGEAVFSSATDAPSPDS